MPFSTFLCYIATVSAPIHAFLEFFFCTIFFPSHWLLFHIIIVGTMDRSVRRMNPVAMTIISPREECWPSRRLEIRSKDLTVSYSSVRSTLCSLFDGLDQDQPKHNMQSDLGSTVFETLIFTILNQL